MIRCCLLFCLALAILRVDLAAQPPSQFITTKSQTFQLNNRPYYFVGTNYWYGGLLGLEKDKRRGIERLRKELDFLKKNGVTNLRLMAGAEGAGKINGVERVGPPLQPELGVFDERTLDGLDIVLDEMAKRQMKAVIFFSNNWEWSGGFQQYVDWNGLVPDELNGRPLNWDELRDMVGRFYICNECRAGYLKQVKFVMERRNTINARDYTDDPTIMAWELANEPRPMWPALRERYIEWVAEVAATIKARDKKHLVTIGHEGSIGTESMDVFETIHRDPNIDYLTIHIWAKNWQWFEAGKMRDQFPTVISKATTYIDDHIAVARRLNKPLVIEEFGLPRDEAVFSPQRRRDAEKTNDSAASKRRMPMMSDFAQSAPRLGVSAVNLPQGSFTPGSPTKLRDEYYRRIFAYIGSGPVAGANFWAFGGTARPRPGQTFWKHGDEWMGDPPMEEQGLNTVFDIDRTTWRVIRAAARQARKRR